MKVTCKLGKKRPAPPPAKTLPKPPSRIARQLALAYRIEWMIEAGELKDYADAAKRLGVTGARISQITKLVGLPILVQEEILTGQFDVTERRLRSSADRIHWSHRTDQQCEQAEAHPTSNGDERTRPPIAAGHSRTARPRGGSNLS